MEASVTIAEALRAHYAERFGNPGAIIAEVAVVAPFVERLIKEREHDWATWWGFVFETGIPGATAATFTREELRSHISERWDRLHERAEQAETVWSKLSVIVSCSSPDGSAELDQVKYAYARAEQAEARLREIDEKVRLRYGGLLTHSVAGPIIADVLALLSAATPGETPRVAHSKSEYKRLKTMGANVLPPGEE